MGKGDKKTKRGKIIMGSYGVRRPHKTKSQFVQKPRIEKIVKAPKKAEVKPEEVIAVTEVIEQAVVETPKIESKPKKTKKVVETDEVKEVKKAVKKVSTEEKVEKPKAKKATKKENEETSQTDLFTDEKKKK
jgi:30S ribosomal protein S31